MGPCQAPAAQRRLRRLEDRKGPPLKGGPFVLPLDSLGTLNTNGLKNRTGNAAILGSLRLADGHYVHEC